MGGGGLTPVPRDFVVGREAAWIGKRAGESPTRFPLGLCSFPPSDYGRVLLQVPISFHRLPPAKLMLVESLHLALVAMGAVSSK